MARSFLSGFFFVAVLSIIVSGYPAHGVPYDYSFTAECLANPLEPQYDGGLVLNPKLNDGLNGWAASGAAKLHLGKSDDGNQYIVASSRNQPFDSFVQELYLEKEKLYTFSAWIQVSAGKADVSAVFKTGSDNKTAGWVVAQKGCWAMLKGGLLVDESGPAHLYFQSHSHVDIWADSISLQAFTQQEWDSHRSQSIDRVRKSKVKLVAVDGDGRPTPNATVTIIKSVARFPFGCQISQEILGNAAYQNWFFPRFRYTVFGNEMKWYDTETSPGKEDYSVADQMLQLVKSFGVSVRGHNVFWDDPQYQVWWTKGLSSNDLWGAVDKRINSVVGRYRGQLIHWDVVNENMHFNYFETKLNPNFSAIYYQTANQIDGSATPFLNEFNTIEESGDSQASPARYLQKIQELRWQGYQGPLGIGLEGHFTTANLPYIRSALDTLASAGLPIWITELDVRDGPNQVTYLDQILREVHAHSAVQGVMLWAGRSSQGCYRMCLTDNNFRNLPTGDVVDKISREWIMEDGVVGVTDADGVFEMSAFHGDYEVRITHPDGNGGDGVSSLKKIIVDPNGEDGGVHLFTINA